MNFRRFDENQYLLSSTKPTPLHQRFSYQLSTLPVIYNWQVSPHPRLKDSGTAISHSLMDPCRISYFSVFVRYIIRHIKLHWTLLILWVCQYNSLSHPPNRWRDHILWTKWPQRRVFEPCSLTRLRDFLKKYQNRPHCLGVSEFLHFPLLIVLAEESTVTQLGGGKWTWKKKQEYLYTKHGEQYKEAKQNQKVNGAKDRRAVEKTCRALEASWRG